MHNMRLRSFWRSPNFPPQKKKTLPPSLAQTPGFFRARLGYLHLLEAVHKLLTSLTTYFFKGTLHGLRSVRSTLKKNAKFWCLWVAAALWFLFMIFLVGFVVGCGHWNKKDATGATQNKTMFPATLFPRFGSAICFSGLHLLARLLCLPKGW